MQYPIIDNLIYAYLANGWTGLDATEMNLWDEKWEHGTYNLNTGEPEPISIYFRTKNYISIRPNTRYYAYTGTQALYLFYYNKDYEYIRYDSSVANMSITTPTNAFYMRFVDVRSNNYDSNIIPISINYPPINQYVSSDITIKNKNEIAHRLKLPLPRYFPHPVIDALISASDGQHMDEEKEILRHYLKPLGIGGI